MVTQSRDLMSTPVRIRRCARRLAAEPDVPSRSEKAFAATIEPTAGRRTRSSGPLRPALGRRVFMKALVRGPIQLQHVEQQRNELAVAARSRKPLHEIVDEPGERWRVHAALLRTTRDIVQKRVDCHVSASVAP